MGLGCLPERPALARPTAYRPAYHRPCPLGTLAVYNSANIVEAVANNSDCTYYIYHKGPVTTNEWLRE